MLGTRAVLHLLQMETISSQHQRIQMCIFGTILIKESLYSRNQNPLGPLSVSPLMPLLRYRGLVWKLGIQRFWMAWNPTNYTEIQQICCRSHHPPLSPLAKSISWTRAQRVLQLGQRRSFPSPAPKLQHHQLVNLSTSFSSLLVRAHPVHMHGV